MPSSSAELPELEQFYNMPTGVFVTIMLVFGMSFALGIKPPLFGHPSFLMHNTALNFFLLILISVCVGSVVLFLPPDSFVARRVNLILLPLLVGAIWGRAYVVYSVNLTNICKAKYGEGDDDTGERASFQQTAVMWNTGKLAAAIFLTYLFVVLVPSWTTVPFNEMYDSTHPLIYFIAIGFWCGCACWSADSSCYFVLKRNQCGPREKVFFRNILSEDDNHDHDGTKPSLVSCS